MAAPAIYKQRVVTDITNDNWWLDPVFDGVDWRAVYHPLGADDLADSYINLVTPGTNNAAPGVAPTHDPARGWIFSISRYLNTGIVPSSTWTMLVRFSNASVDGGIVAGSNTAAANKRFYLRPRLTTTDQHAYANGSSTALEVSPRLTSGVMALAGKDGYLNGTDEGDAAAGAWTGDEPIYIGAFNNGGSAANFFTGDVQAVAIAATDLTQEQIDAAYAYLIALEYNAPAEVDTTRFEMFLDETNIESMSAQLDRTVNTPTKYGSNPVFNTSAPAGAYNYGKIFVDVLKFSPTSYKMWYTAAEDSGSVVRRLAYATSSDGLSWTNPNLGLVTYDGNTNNGIQLDHPAYNAAVDYDNARAAGTQYLILMEQTPTGGDDGIFIWKSSDGINWTSHKTVVLASTFGDSVEAKDFVELDNGRWIAYFTTGHGDDDRKIGAYMSDTSTITGDWTYQGIVLPNAGPNNQRYALGVEKVNENFLGFCMDYDSSTGRVHMDLYYSRDGLSWTLVSDEWVPRGSGGTFDDEMIFAGKSLVHVGDEWWFYYCGFVDDHHGGQPRDAQVGIAQIGYGRIGQMQGSASFSNHFTTTVLEPDPGTSLYVNCDASGGGLIRVAVLDEYGSEIEGFGLLDSDEIDVNTFDLEVFWNGESLPTGERIKLQFQMPFNDAILYSYQVR